ncbi:MAG TPA: glutathione S-transferase family protein, partial [Burkholderiaceae bacterium]
MTLRISGRQVSINVRKVLWTAAEIGLPVDHDAAPDPATLRALNPNALVPVIEDEGFVLWESNAICRYLAARHGRVDLLPADPAARARVEQWMDWQATELNPAWRPAFLALMRGNPERLDAAGIAASAAAWNARMALLDAHLASGRAYVAGDAFTLADLVLALCTHRWHLTPV